MSRKELTRCTPEQVGVPSATILELLDALESFPGCEMHALMIMRHGKVCAEGWWQPFAPGQAHICWSQSKTYTATGIGILITQGKLSLDTRILDLFPEFAPEQPSENLQKLCIRHLLTMSCGMREMGPEGYGWLPNFLKMNVDYEPGSVFMYNSMGTNALGAVIKRVSCMDPEDFFRKELYEKLGMDLEQCFWTKIPDGYIWSAGGLFATTENNLRLMQLYLQNGVWNGERILSEEYVRLATTAQIDNSIGYTPEGGIIPQFESKQGYGYQIWMNSYPGSYRSDGAQGQYGIVFPRENLIVVINETLEGDSDELFQTIYKILLTSLRDDALPENEAECQKLRERMRRLAIPAPACRPLTETAIRISGTEYSVQEGTFTFLTAFEPREFRNTGIRVSDGIDHFSFDFKESCCEMRYVENGKPWNINIAMDGTRSKEILAVEKHTPTKVLFSGTWVSETVFEVKARWIESTVEKTICFMFDDDSVSVEAKLTLGTLGAYKNPDEIAVARALVGDPQEKES